LQGFLPLVSLSTYFSNRFFIFAGIADLPVKNGQTGVNRSGNIFPFSLRKATALI
jgi:hypothetical protein